MASNRVIVYVCPEMFQDLGAMRKVKSVIVGSLFIFFRDQGFVGNALDNIARIKPEISPDNNLSDEECSVEVILVFARYLKNGFPEEFIRVIESRFLALGIKARVRSAKKKT